MHLQGEGVPRDLIEAHVWFNLASADGDPEAIEERTTLECRMTPLQIAKAQQLAGVAKMKMP